MWSECFSWSVCSLVGAQKCDQLASYFSLRLKEFGQAYELVKTERNKSHSSIQVFHQVGRESCESNISVNVALFSQVGAELREKLKVLQNEIEILRNSVDSKTKYRNSVHGVFGLFNSPSPSSPECWESVRWRCPARSRIGTCSTKN